MSTSLWFEHFKHKLQGLTESFESADTRLSLLGHAFHNQNLTSEEYLPWAMAHFQLPKLHSRFFTETPPSQEMFAKWATHYRWSEECLPVAEWDGSLIVACLQPPQDFPTNPSAILVLCSFESLQDFWKILHSSSASAPSISSAAAPEGIDLSLAAKPSTKSSDSFSFDDLGDSSSSEDNSEEAIDDSESSGEVIEDSDSPLEGIFDTPASSVSLSALATPIGDVSPSDDLFVATDGPTTIAPSPIASVLQKQKAPESAPQKSRAALSAKSEPLEVMAEKTQPDVKLESPSLKIDQPAILASLPKNSVPEVMPTPMSAPIPPPPQKVEANTPTLAPKSKPASKPMSNPASPGTFALEKIKKNNVSKVDEKIKYALDEMRNHFEKSMILTLDDKETQLTAFAWDEYFQGMKDTSIRVPLKVPSIFNIVASTQKSFHGYISLNEINEKFFEDWNQGKIPDHVTIAPLMIGDKMVGMLMGFASKSAYNKASLSLTEKLSVEFVKGLQAA